MATITQPTQGSNIVADATLSNYVFASGVHKPEFSSYLTYCYPQYTLTSLLDRIGRFEAVNQDTFSWSEVERTREVATITSAAALGGDVFDVTTSETVQYFLPKDVVKLANDKIALVTAVAIVGGFQVHTVESIDSGAPLVIGDFVATELISHLYNLHEEYSTEPDARTFLPEVRENKLNILRRTCAISTTEYSNMIWMNINGKPFWYYADEQIAMNEFARDREICILRGAEAVGTSTSAIGGKGLLAFVENGGVLGTYSGNVVEADIMEMIRALIISSPADEFLVLAGSEFLKDATIALRDYYVNGGVDYGMFGSINTVGLTLQSYTFLGKTIHFVHYQLFDDPKVFPQQAGGIDYSDFSLWLNMGNDENGRPLINGKYKRDPNGTEFKFLRKVTPGISSPLTGGELDGIAVNGQDGFKVHLYSYLGLELRCENQHGILYRV